MRTLNLINMTELKVLKNRVGFEVSKNEIENEWWFDLGISFQKTNFHHEFKSVLTISIILISIYVRFK